MSILNWVKYMDGLKSGLSNCNYWESRTLYFWTGTLKIWYPCILDSFNLDLSGNTANNITTRLVQ